VAIALRRGLAASRSSFWGGQKFQQWLGSRSASATALLVLLQRLSLGDVSWQGC